MAELDKELLNFNPSKQGNGEAEINPTLSLAENIRIKYPPLPVNKGQRMSALSTPVQAFNTPDESYKVSFQDKVIDPMDAYVEVGGGTTSIARYEDYIYGTDNKERLALQQSTGEKWANGLGKLVLKTGSSALGGTVGAVTGAFNAIEEGSLSALYTDDFNKMLDNYNERLDYKLPNYVSKEEENMSLVRQMGTANFWANDALGGLSFTLGMIVSEGIWAAATGGTSLIAKGALGAAGRWSTRALGSTKALRGVQKFKEPVKDLLIKGTQGFDDAISLGKGTPLLGAAKTADNLAGSGALSATKRASILGSNVPKALNQARFIYTSAGYEAGVEARHYMKETREQWMMDYETRNGRKPTATEIAEFDNNLTDSANAVFGTNLALVGSSNIAIFGKMLLSKSVKPAVSQSWMKRNLFGIGYNMEGTTAKALKATTRQKVAGKVYSKLRAPLIEGVYEEGGQSVAAKTMKNYVLSAYDEEATQENLSLADSLIEGLKETYGTKEGLKEVTIGAIIGLFGGGIATGGRFNQLSQERQNIENVTEYRNEFKPDRVLASQITAERMKANNRIYRANREQAEAANRGDITGEFMSEQQSALASIERDSVLQGRKQGIKDFEAYLNTVNNTELAEELGISEEEVTQWKQEKLEEYSNLSEKYAENEQYARALIGDTPLAGTKKMNTSEEQIIRALAYNLTIGEQSKRFAEKLAEDIKMTVAGGLGASELNTALDVDAALSNINKEKYNKYSDLLKQTKTLEQQRTNIENQIVSAQYRSQDAEARKSALEKLQGRIIEVNEKLDKLNQEKDTAFRALGIKNDLITESDLSNQAQMVQELQEQIEGYKDTNPETYSILNKLFDEYNRAKSNTRSFNELTKQLIDPQMRVSTMNGWLSGFINKNKTFDESTQEFFKSQLEQYEKNRTQGKISSSEAQQDTTQTGQPEEDVAEEGDLMRLPMSTETTTEEAPQTSIEFLKEKISDIMKGSKYITSYIGDNFDEAVKNKPSQEDVDRYEELLAKVNSKYISNFVELMTAPASVLGDTGLTKAELKELKVLQDKLSKWNVLEGALDSENNAISDLLLLVEQLQTKIDKQDTKKKREESDYVELKRASQTEVNEKFTRADALQSPDQVLAQITEEEDGEVIYTFSHLDVTSLTRLFPNSSLEVMQNKVSKRLDTLSKSKLNRIKKKEGQEFMLVTPQGNVKVTIGERAGLKMNRENLDSLLESSNIAIVKYGGGNFLDVYEELENGDLIPLRGDFDYESTLENEILQIDPERINSIREGEILLTKVNLNDVYNKDLIAEYKGKKNPTEEDYEYLMNNLHIYINDQEGNLIGSLRANRGNLEETTSGKNLLEMRRKAVDMILNETNEGDYFSLNEAVPVNTILIGSPNLVIRDQDGNLKPSTIDFTDSALEKVEDAGYYQGNTLTLKSLNADNVIKTFLPKESNQKLPIVVVNVNGKSVAYPVDLKSTTANKVSELDEIFNSGLSDAKIANKVAELLIQNGLNPQDYQGTENLFDADLVYEAFESIEEYPDVTDWVNTDFNLNNLKTQAEISIDLDNKPFHMSKVILGMDKARSIGLQERIRMKYGSLEDREIQALNYLQSYMMPIEAQKNEYPDVDDVRWTNELFYENAFNFEQTGFVFQQKNARMIMRALYNEKGDYVSPPKAVREAYGEQFFKDLRADLDNYREILSLKEKMKADIKNAELNEQKKNQNTKCK